MSLYEAAQRILELRAEASTQARIDRLAEKANEGQLSEAERAEYEQYLTVFHLITVLQAKMRSMLESKANFAMSNQLLEAISFAARKHQGQMRKDGCTPYFAHPVRVMTVLLTEFGVTDVETLAAAVLHDTIEDTTTDYDDITERFGERVVRFVALLTKDARLPEEEREERFLAELTAAPLEVRLCKLADTYDNLVDSQSLTPAGRRKAVAKAQKLLAAFTPTMPDAWRHALDKVRERLKAVEGEL